MSHFWWVNLYGVSWGGQTTIDGYIPSHIHPAQVKAVSGVTELWAIKGLLLGMDPEYNGIVTSRHRKSSSSKSLMR